MLAYSSPVFPAAPYPTCTHDDSKRVKTLLRRLACLNVISRMSSSSCCFSERECQNLPVLCYLSCEIPSFLKTNGGVIRIWGQPTCGHVEDFYLCLNPVLARIQFVLVKAALSHSTEMLFYQSHLNESTVHV